VNTRESFRVRAYRTTDAHTTFQIFHRAITVTASADYTAEQITAWAQTERWDIAAWDLSMRRRKSYVAVIGEQVVGFSDISDDGYIDMLYVSPDVARRGVARELLTFLEHQARSHGAKRLTANVSITARKFFEALGFQIVAEQHPVLDDVVFTNFRMMKLLGTDHQPNVNR